MKTQSTVSSEHKMVYVDMLGGFELRLDDMAVNDSINRSGKMWNMLAYFVIYRNRNIPQSELIDILWPEEDSSNPLNALKTLLYRTRNILFDTVGTDVPLLMSQRGSYSWNHDLDCTLDAEEFEELFKHAEDKTLADSERLELYKQCVNLYKGDFLPKLSDQLWVVPLATHYHELYINAVKSYANLLKEAQMYAEISELCTKALQIEPYDEHIHALMVLSLLRQGKNTAALNHYETATDQLYRNLGVRPSEELRALYVEIMKEQKSLETDLSIIQESLREAAAKPGAFVCEYGFFKEAYRLEARRASRLGSSIYIGLLTLTTMGGSLPPLDTLNNAMERLLDVLVSSLRKGDVISRFSGAQYVLMLPSVTFEDGTMVMERIINAYYAKNKRTFVKINYKLQQLDIVC